MAHLRVLQIVKQKGKAISLEILPGEFSSDREARDSIKKSGEYLFIEAHKIGDAKPEDDGTPVE